MPPIKRRTLLSLVAFFLSYGLSVGDGDIDPRQRTSPFPFPDGGTITMKAVYNRYEPSETIAIRTTIGLYTVEAPPIAVTYQIRKYTTEQGYTHTNDFDENTAEPEKTFQYWVDYWDD